MLDLVFGRRIFIVAACCLILAQACGGLGLDEVPELPEVQDIVVTPIDPSREAVATSPAPLETENPAASIASTPQTGPSRIVITAVKGNLFIRRGPDMAYNPVGVLYEGTSAAILARDMLSDWVQITIPGSTSTGWVSIQTRYSQLEGSLKEVPAFTPTEWPAPAFLRNCTYHRMFVMPGEITLPSYSGYPENEVWLYPGIYTVYDFELPDLPEVIEVEMREGLDVEIKVDGLGERRNCP